MELRYLILALTSRCNLRCRYCYLAAESRGRDMDSNILTTALAMLPHAGSCHVQITGGEPTLVPELIEQVGKECRAVSGKITLAIQTNASLLTPELIKLFTTYSIEVGVSLDGIPAIHDSVRGRIDDTLCGLHLLEAHQIPFRVTTVVTADNVAHLDTLALMLSGFASCRGIGLDLLVNKLRGRALLAPLPQKLQQGITALVKMLEQINSRRSNPIRLREMDICHLGKKRKTNRKFCRAAAGQSLAVTPDGSLYPCSQTMYDPMFAMGTVFSPDIPKPQPLTKIHLNSKKCPDCQLNKQCPGDCPSRLYYGRNENDLACTLYQTIHKSQPHYA